MEGGRGGGRGKGKKSKAAKKKAAAAAKKVPANSSNVQVVSVSTAPEAAAAHEPMAKSKRKRLKKLLKAAKQQEIKKSPTAAPPKPKVAVLSETSTAAARPHVVSLSSKKKKKRKRNVSESEENVAVASAKEEQTSEGKKSPGIKKKIVVLSHSGASPTATSTPAQQDVEKVAVKPVEKVLSPRKMVKKVKTKPAVVSPKEVQPVVHKTQVKTEKNLNVVVGATKATAVATAPKITKPVVPLTRKSDQVNTSASQQTHASNEAKSDTSSSTSLLSHVVATSKKASVKESKPERELASTGTDKPANSGSELNAVVSTSAAFSEQPDTIPIIASAASSTPGHATAQESVPTGVTGSANAPANTIPDLDQSVTSALAGKKASTSSKLTNESLKRRRSVDQVSTSASSDSLQPPAKRAMVSREVVKLITAEESGSRDIRATTVDLVPQARTQQANSRTQASNAEINSTDISRQVEGDAPIATSANRTLPPARPPPTQDISGQTPVSDVRSTVQSASNRPLKAAAESMKPSVRIQEPIDKQLQPQTGASPALCKIKVVTPGSVTKVSSGRDSNRSTVEIVMDSHSYVEKMMKSELDMKKSGGSRDNPEQQTVTLPTRPQNAWGASFGMVPPSTVATRPARSLSTTPLSSWFLSKGCANFVKHVHFSDDDEDNCSNNGDFTGRPPTPRMISEASPKWRASSAKKNAFLESLTAQSNWRTWYGSVDVHNLLDPPLAFIPEKLRTHEVTPLSLPEPVAANTVNKKKGALELLETDIKREKQRGSAFSEQLLMMLQGKTVSGKLLGDEYKALLH